MNISNFQPDHDQARAVDLIQRGHNVFLTGRAGSGKSTVVNWLRDFGPEGTVFLAPTGLAALNIGGSTIHSFLSLPPTYLPPGYVPPHMSSAQAEVLSAVRTIVIDEISMVRSDVLDAVESTLRQYPLPGCEGRPFGGRQVVAVGDFFQLPPVISSPDEQALLDELHGGGYAFESRSWRAAAFEPVVLGTVHRQAGDLTYLQLLDGLRTAGHGLGDGGLERIVEHFNHLVPTGIVSGAAVHLCTTRREAYLINHQRDEYLGGGAMPSVAVVTGRFDLDSCPAEETLRFRIGSRVMLLCNTPDYANGDTGVVVSVSIQDDRWIVDIVLDDGRYVQATPNVWSDFDYTVLMDSDGNCPMLLRQWVGSLQQLPFKLAYAMTIHKAQGITLDRVHVRLGRGTFAHGQLYTALSRCRSLSSLSMERPLRIEDVLVDQEVVRFHEKLQ